MSDERKVLLELRKLKKYFPVRRGVQVRALEDISFSIYEGEKFGVVGESGCGKSTLGRVILQLYRQSGGACIYYGHTPEELHPAYAMKEIEKLGTYQKRAGELYRKALELDRRAGRLGPDAAASADGDGGAAPRKTEPDRRLSRLEQRAASLHAAARRQLEEGSRTVGSLILCRDLPAVQELFKKALAEPSRAGVIRQEAFERYRGKDLLPLADRASDLEWQGSLDKNLETGINLGRLTDGEMRRMRREMQMIFQDPAASLDPRQSVGKAIEEVYVIHTDEKPAARREKVMDLLEQVGLKREHYYSYPHALSGGQKQRVGIARAIALDTRFIVLDEAVSALDVSVQAQILQLLNELSVKKQLTYFFITHDLGVVRHFCDRILVMYLGNVCELADSSALFHGPLHPYTQSLLAAVPRLSVGQEHSTEFVLEGDVPSAMNPPSGCPFHTRCRQCMEICTREKPELIEREPGHFVSCHLYSAGQAGEACRERTKKT